jgi:hypothetical protein
MVTVVIVPKCILAINRLNGLSFGFSFCGAVFAWSVSNAVPWTISTTGSSRGGFGPVHFPASMNYARVSRFPRQYASALPRVIAEISAVL